MALTAALLLAGCQKHFMTDRGYRNMAEADFRDRAELLPEMDLDTLSAEEREAMEFLYAYMPYSDLADYEPEFFLNQVRYAFMARDTFGWDVPEDVFRHFVLVYRVNNEDLDTARMLMFHQLKDRVKGLSMEEAALEVNHWCHEYVAYRAADIRTSAPLATMRTSLGRCGEESTFAVTALRSVGIPARQCYTPRWAHCDDNHAWVEVWVDGVWKFLGACEPDPALDMGWFAVPSTRCLMVHSKAFGRYQGDEEVVRKTPLYSELNLLSHYAPTRKVTVTVLNQDGSPARNTEVMFKMYNYAEYYTLASYPVDEDGKASLTTGLGDILVWATDGKDYGYAKIDVRTTGEATLYLNHTEGTPYVEELDIVPPAAGQAKTSASEEAAKANDLRKLQEDSIRNAYTASFPAKEDCLELVPRTGLSAEQVWDIIRRSEGNHRELAAFLNAHPEKEEHLYDYLCSYSDKDLRDTKAETFEAQYCSNSARLPREAFLKGILPARISNELVRDWRKPLAESLKGLRSAQEVKAWILENIKVDDTGNYYNCPISPMGVYRLRHSDAHSRDIFFVAACRALGMPAYLDNATNTLYTWEDEGWHKVSFGDGEAPQPSARLTLTYSGKEPQTPVYYPHFTIQKFVDGDFVSFDFEGDPRMEHFPATIQVEPGYYCLSTGRRLDDGSVLSRLEFFEIPEGGSVTREIRLRSENSEQTILGRLDPKMPFGMSDLADYADKSGMLFCFLGDYKEPSKHLVKEILALQEEWKAWGGMTYLAAPREADAASWNLVNTDIITDTPDSEMERKVARALDLDLKGDYPFVALVNSHGEILFANHGYRIGLAEAILAKARM